MIHSQPVLDSHTAYIIRSLVSLWLGNPLPVEEIRSRRCSGENLLSVRLSRRRRLAVQTPEFDASREAPYVHYVFTVYVRENVVLATGGNRQVCKQL